MWCKQQQKPEGASALSGQHWFVTITPYGQEVEPGVPPKDQVLKHFLRLSRNLRSHDPASSLLLGHVLPGDVIREAKQESWSVRQLSMFD